MSRAAVRMDPQRLREAMQQLASEKRAEVRERAKRIKHKGQPRPCSVAGCELYLYAKGMCFNHYMRDYQRRRRAQAGRSVE